LPQVKVVLSTLDPLGMPVVKDVVSGNRADDPLYIPAIQRVRDGLGEKGLLYIGDYKIRTMGRGLLPKTGETITCVRCPRPNCLKTIWRRTWSRCGVRIKR